MNFDEIPTGDVVIAGPSCVPFSRVGKQASWLDSKSRSFLAVLQCIRSQAVRQGSKLKVFIIENVLGFGTNPRMQSVPLRKKPLSFLSASSVQDGSSGVGGSRRWPQAYRKPAKGSTYAGG